MAVRVQGLGGIPTHGLVINGQIREENDWEVNSDGLGRRVGRKCIISSFVMSERSKQGMCLRNHFQKEMRKSRCRMSIIRKNQKGAKTKQKSKNYPKKENDGNSDEKEGEVLGGEVPF